jgi:stress-induced morphogen
MTSKTKARWEKMRDRDSRQIESVLRAEFPNTDAYRYNSASIRIRVVDDRFKGKSAEKRDAMVERLLETLPEYLQADIVNLLTVYPGETDASLATRLANDEFENPSPSRL